MPLPPALGDFFLPSAAGAESELLEESVLEPLLDGENYFRELGLALSTLGTKSVAENTAAGEFIYIASFMLNFTGLEVPIAGVGQSLEAVLVDKAAKGVDVRVLGWAHYALNPPSFTPRRIVGLFGKDLDDFGPAIWNAETAKVILRLRAGVVGAGAALNVISHPGGSSHAKLVIIGDDDNFTAFTGGMDLTPKRYALLTHPGDTNDWHDAALKIRGLAAKPCYVLFKDLWNQNKSNEAIIFRIAGGSMMSMWTTASLVPVRIPRPAPAAAGPHYAQSLRTLPARLSSSIMMPNPPLFFWPSAGVFEVRDALLRAISKARQYIYIEDQYFWSEEILIALKVALLDATRPALRVILLTGSMQDPADEAKVKTYRDYFMWMNLVIGLTAPQLARLKFYARWGEILPIGPPDHEIAAVTAWPGSTDTDLVISDVTMPSDYGLDELSDLGAVFTSSGQRFRIKGNPVLAKDAALVALVSGGAGNPRMTPGTYQIQRAARIFVHTKTVIIDDSWALIGSTNMARRGMRTDVEHSTAFTSQDGGIVKEYRKNLWAHHILTTSMIDPLPAALEIFFPPAPRRFRSEAEFPDYIEPVLISAVSVPANLAKSQKKYDADSTIPDWSPL